MTTPILAPVEFEPPLVNPAAPGLFAATAWQTDDVPRWLDGGKQFRVWNYSGDAFGVWTAPWCVAEDDLEPEDVKAGDRPDVPDPFLAMTVWAFDQCDLTEPSQAEVRAHASQNLRLREQAAVEAEFAARMLADAGAPDTAADIVGALGHLEGLLAVTNTVGFIHASAEWAASAAQAQLIVRTGTGLKTPLGHTWVFGGGYVGAGGLTDTLVATSPTFGWRTEPEVRDAFKLEWNRFAAVAERSLVVGYEALVGAVDITG